MDRLRISPKEIPEWLACIDTLLYERKPKDAEHREYLKQLRGILLALQDVRAEKNKQAPRRKKRPTSK